MKSLQDSLYNWLTIKVVAEGRPNDHAAQQTYTFFTKMLVEDYKIEKLSVEKEEEVYWVKYELSGEAKKTRFPIDLIDSMFNQIEQEPEKYKNFPDT